MKRLFYIAVAAIVALSSCSSESDPMSDPGVTTFYAQIDGGTSTRASIDYSSNPAHAKWEPGDQISLDGHIYTADSDAGKGVNTCFTGKGATEAKHHAYFPTTIYSDGTLTMPESQIYDGKFNVPMYAVSSNNILTFRCLFSILAVNIRKTDDVTISNLRKVKVESDMSMWGEFTIAGDSAAVFKNQETNKAVLLDCTSNIVPITEAGTTLLMAVPSREYKYINIYISQDGNKYQDKFMTIKSEDGSAFKLLPHKMYYAKYLEGGLYVTETLENEDKFEW